MSAQTQRTWVSFGLQVRDLRLERRWTIRELAHRAGISPGMVYRVESGAPASTHTAEVLAAALSRRVELRLVDPRARRDMRSQHSIDPVHSVMGESEAGHLRRMSFSVGVDEPYQHYQFAGAQMSWRGILVERLCYTSRTAPAFQTSRTWPVATTPSALTLVPRWPVG